VADASNHNSDLVRFVKRLARLATLLQLIPLSGCHQHILPVWTQLATIKLALEVAVDLLHSILMVILDRGVNLLFELKLLLS